MQDFSHIDTWVFDLDNTLYDAEKQVFDLVATRMTDFVASFLKVDTVEAARLRKHYYKTYGTTLRGLMTEHALDPGDFLTYVHDIDYSMIDPCAITRAGLSRLAGRKVVFTNAPKHFALRMIDHLGIA
jgi:putative hydrolase of the HAD superfamily